MLAFENRQVISGNLVRDQADFFVVGSDSVRQPGLVAVNISASLFSNNVYQTWQFLDGAGIPDSSISSGAVYFNEIVGSPGFYSIRFFPNAMGFWKLSLTWSSGNATLNKCYDVVPSAINQNAGLIASFTR